MPASSYAAPWLSASVPRTSTKAGRGGLCVVTHRFVSILTVNINTLLERVTKGLAVVVS